MTRREGTPMMFGRRIGLATLSLLVLAGCGSGFTLGMGTIVVQGLAPGQSLLCGSGSSTVQFTGSGFNSEHGNLVTIRWTALSGTPFAGSATATTQGTVLSDSLFEAQIPNVVGSIPATVTIILPGGNEGTSPPLTLEVGGVQVGPFALDDAFEAVGNTELSVGAAQGLLVNDQDASCGPIPEKPGTAGGPATAVNATVTAFDATSTLGGTVSVSANGSFTYRPPVGVGQVAGSTTPVQDSFTYTISEAGRPDSTATVRLNLCEIVWYIDSAAATNGGGTSWAPFNSLPAFMAKQGGGTTDSPAAGHWIYMYPGDGQPYQDGISLLADQKLIGGGVDLVVCDQTLVPATTRPTIENTGLAIGETVAPPVITLGDRNVVRGLDVVAGVGDGIFGAFVTGPTLIDVVGVRQVDGAGVHLTDIVGTFDIGDRGAGGSTPRVTVMNVGGTGVLVRGPSQGTIQGPVGLGAAATAAGPQVNVSSTTITNPGLHGIDCADANLDVLAATITQSAVGIDFRTTQFLASPCTLQCTGSTVGLVGQACQDRGIQIQTFGAGIDATIATTAGTAQRECVYAEAVSGDPITIALHDDTFQTLVPLLTFVTGPLPTVDLEGIEGGITVRRLENMTILGNGMGGGVVADACFFDADPNAPGQQVVAGGTLTCGQGTGATQRVAGTALQIVGCIGGLTHTTADIFQVGGVAAGFTNTDPLGFTLTFGTLNVDQIP